MPTIAELGRLAASQTVKHASTALVRRIAQGVLSPQSIQRAAQAMPVGSFRTIGNLGRGQFSLADKVIGNMPRTGLGAGVGGGNYAGLMARKLPTRVVPTPAVEYRPISRITNQFNSQYTVPGSAPPIAPYEHIGPQGGFQRLATGNVQPPKELTRQLSDLHAGNIGPNGQIVDYGLSQQLPRSLASDPRYTGDGLRTTLSGNSPPSISNMYNYPSIRPGRYVLKNQDEFGNIRAATQAWSDNSNVAGKAYADKLYKDQAVNNNFIRKYWSQPATQRAGMLHPDVNQAAGWAHQSNYQRQNALRAQPAQASMSASVAAQPASASVGGKTFVPQQPVPSAFSGKTVVPQQPMPAPQWSTNRSGGILDDTSVPKPAFRPSVWQDMQLSPAPYAVAGAAGAGVLGGVGYGGYKGYQALTNK